MLLQLSAAALPAIELAAHQAVWSMYAISSFATSTLEQAGLAFLPRAKTPQQSKALIGITRTLGLCMGTCLGSICWLLATCLPALFTADAAVQFHMARIAPWCGTLMIIVGADVSAVAVLISLGFSRYLARSFVITFVALFAFMAMLSRQPGGISLLGVWGSLLFFFVVRCTQSYLGILLMAGKGRRGADGQIAPA